MKYKILQRYYENTIAAAPEAGDDSLLAAYGGDGGHLTDEHFKHMAEVSGTNIRELESFCERCAGEAGDREREGSELSFDDIDASQVSTSIRRPKRSTCRRSSLSLKSSTA